MQWLLSARTLLQVSLLSGTQNTSCINICMGLAAVWRLISNMGPEHVYMHNRQGVIYIQHEKPPVVLDKAGTKCPWHVQRTSLAMLLGPGSMTHPLREFAKSKHLWWDLAQLKYQKTSCENLRIWARILCWWISKKGSSSQADENFMSNSKKPVLINTWAGHEV